MTVDYCLIFSHKLKRDTFIDVDASKTSLFAISLAFQKLMSLGLLDK